MARSGETTRRRQCRRLPKKNTPVLIGGWGAAPRRFRGAVAAASWLRRLAAAALVADNGGDGRPVLLECFRRVAGNGTRVACAPQIIGRDERFKLDFGSQI